MHMCEHLREAAAAQAAFPASSQTQLWSQHIPLGVPRQGAGDAVVGSGTAAAESNQGRALGKSIMALHFWTFSTRRFTLPVRMPFCRQPRGTGMSEPIPSHV